MVAGKSTPSAAAKSTLRRVGSLQVVKVVATLRHMDVKLFAVFSFVGYFDIYDSELRR